MATTKKLPIAFSSGEKKRGTLKAFGEIRRLLKSEDNWIKGHYHYETDDGNDTYCLIGAAEKVDGTQEERVKAVMCYALSLKKYGEIDIIPEDDDVWISSNQCRVTSWNDAKKRKHSEILDFLDKCIKIVKSAKTTKGKRNLETSIVL